MSLGHYEVWLILVIFLSKTLIYLFHLVTWTRSQGIIFNSSIHLIHEAWESPRLVRKCVHSFLSTPQVQLWIRPSPLNHSSSFCWVFYLYIIPVNQPSTPIGGLPIVLNCHVQTPYHGLWPITMCRPSSMSLIFTIFIPLAGKCLLNLPYPAKNDLSPLGPLLTCVSGIQHVHNPPPPPHTQFLCSLSALVQCFNYLIFLSQTLYTKPN